jgi:hypothetical protein
MDDIPGCPACNPQAILPALDAEGLLAFEVSTGEQSVQCECGKRWVLVAREEMTRG